MGNFLGSDVHLNAQEFRDVQKCLSFCTS
jgi:hypothetical protein